MNRYIPFVLLLCLLVAVSCIQSSLTKPEVIFNGKNFDGWEGDTTHTWRVQDGAIVGGSLDENVPHNDFLCTRKSYSDFVLKLKFKLTGT